MGRHSRKGSARTEPGGDADRSGAAEGAGTGRRRRSGAAQAPASVPAQDARLKEAHGPHRGHGTADGRTPAPPVRGGHPEHREAGGGWGGGPYAAAPDPAAQPPRAAARIAQGPPRIPGPRREFVEAFDEPAEGGAGGHRPGADAEGGEGAPQRRSGFGRAFAGVVAAAVTTVLAVVVAGQVADGQRTARGARAADASARPGGDDPVSRSDERPTPSQGSASPSPTASAPAPPTYAVLMTRQFDVDPGLKGSGDFEAVPGADPAPGKGRKVRYRVDVEKGLDLDAALFARAVQETLNDDRSWAHGGAMTFERISSGDPDFVITLASPGTTGVWCAKSGLDTTVDNVSCDSAATQRIMINAYRWARGADTYGPDRMLAYRQMLINHEVGHRLGHNHENCRKPGGLAPVMQQQTKTLEIGGISCRPNPWVHPSA